MSIRELIHADARARAAHDGVEVSFMHLFAAAGALIVDARRELDALVADIRPAGAAAVPPHATDPAAPANGPSEPGAAPGAPSAAAEATGEASPPEVAS